MSSRIATAALFAREPSKPALPLRKAGHDHSDTVAHSSGGAFRTRVRVPPSAIAPYMLSP